MANKILTVKQYIKEKALNSIDERLTQAFANYLQKYDVGPIKYVKNVTGCFATKLKVKLVVSDETNLPLKEIFSELVDLYHKNNQKQIIVSALWVTPVILDPNSIEIHRGIIAVIKYV